MKADLTERMEEYDINEKTAYLEIESLQASLKLQDAELNKANKQ